MLLSFCGETKVTKRLKTMLGIQPNFLCYPKKTIRIIWKKRFIFVSLW